MSKRSIRKKSVLSFNDEEEEELGAARPPAAIKAAQAQRQKPSNPAGKPLLSFDDDVGVQAGSKKSAGGSSGRAKASLRVAPPPPGSAAANAGGLTAFASSAGEYTAERLSELRKNARSFPGGDGRTAQPSPAVAPGGFTLAGSFKARAPPKDDRFQYNVRAAGVVAPAARKAQSGKNAQLPPPSAPPPPLPPGDEVPPPPPPLPPAAAGVQPPQQQEEEEELDIPDDEMIKWAKAKRERMRAAHVAPDYISLQGPPQGPGLGSRLRDQKAADAAGPGAAADVAESGSDEEPENDLRLQFLGKAPGSKGKAERPVLAASAEAEAGGEEEEDDQWAEEQIRKGMGGLMRPEAAAAAKAAGGRPPSGLAEQQQQQQQAGAGGQRGGTVGAGASQAAAIAAAASEVLKSLQAGVVRLQTSQRQAEKNLARTTQHLQDSLSAVGRLEGQLISAGDKYAYVQRLRAYIADLCNMLADKSPLVEELEEQQQALQQQRAERQREASKGADEEAFPAAEAAVSAVLGVLSRGGDPAAAAQAGEVAAAAAEDQLLSSNGPVELDEFGRDLNAERKHAAVQRARQRAVALAQQQQRLTTEQPVQGQGEVRLGEDSSEEGEGEAERYSSRQAEIQEVAAAAFRDAADEFASVGAVKRQLEEWKQRQPAAYRDAYVSVSAPAIFAPFVRLELLGWQPLHGGATGFDGQRWYQELFDFGQPQDPAEADPDDPDADLLPQLVAKLVLPLARHLLAEVWQPISSRQSTAAAAVLSDLLVYLPADDLALQEVFQLVQTRLTAAVEATKLPPWPPAALAACPRAAVLLAQRFSQGVRLLQCASAFNNVLPRGMLQRLALERLLSQQLLPYARAASSNLRVAADRASRLAEALPAEWFSAAPAPRGAEGLLELLTALAKAAQALAKDTSQFAVNKGVARQLAAALRKLGAPAAGVAVAKAYSVL